MNTTDQQEQEALIFVPDVSSIKQELELTDPATISVVEKENDPLSDQAREVTDRIFSLDLNDMQSVSANKASVETLGLKVQQQAAQRSEMLKEPIKTLSANSEDGGPVARSLVDLKMQVEALDPAKFDFTPGWFSRTLGLMPFVGTPLKRYFTKYETSQTVLDAIRASLVKGQEQLKRDNVILVDDQAAFNSDNIVLEKAVKLGQLIDTHLAARLERESDEKRRRFIQDEILFPLRQRIQDLQQSIIVNQQGVIAIELIIRTNKELIRGVQRAINTTMSALSVAVTVATAVAHQKIVLDKILGVKQVTDDLILNTAKMLRQNVAETNKLASSTSLDMDALRQAFVDINATLDDISNFRRDALPKMASSIIELDEMSKKQGEKIQELEDGNKSAGVLSIDIT